MHFNIFTLFPEMFGCYFGVSILERVQARGLVDLAVHDIRDFAHDRHRVTDEPPFGGGGGMILKPEPIFRAVEAVTGVDAARRGPVILLTPQGRQFTQSVAQELAQHEQLNLIAGRYEGVDERVRAHLVTDELSIGDYVLTGGELAAMVVVDAIVRLLPGALGAEGAAESDSYATGLLEGPHYTRPASFRGWEAPAVLRSGHAANIARWRREQALRRTWERRPELLLTAPLDEQDRFFLGTLAEESAAREAEW